MAKRKSGTVQGKRVLFVSRAGLEKVLVQELGERYRAEEMERGSGTVLASVRGETWPCIFARLWMGRPEFIERGRLNPLGSETLRSIVGRTTRDPETWGLLTLPIGQDAEGRLARRLGGLSRAILREAARQHGWTPSPPRSCGRVLALGLTDAGLWVGEAAGGDELDWFRSGREPLRAKMDGRAPSRSYLKIEEAFMRMGEYPRRGQKVIDLGAAPGGWTFACWKRGCDVLAVDHGPMKLPPREPEWGRVTHVRANGISFQPPREWARADWLVADMLVAPGVALGLLKRWEKAPGTRRVICNIKLPQQEPFGAIAPIEAWIRSSGIDARIVHLVHDRREVTLMGAL